MSICEIVIQEKINNLASIKPARSIQARLATARRISIEMPSRRSIRTSGDSLPLLTPLKVKIHSQLQPGRFISSMTLGYQSVLEVRTYSSNNRAATTTTRPSGEWKMSFIHHVLGLYFPSLPTLDRT